MIQSAAIRALFVASLACTTRVIGQPAVSAQQHADKAVEFLQRGALNDAENELRRAVQLSPQDVTLLTSLGGVLGMEGKLQEANTYLSRAVKANPEDRAARRNLAANDWQLGRLKEAHETLDTLLQSDPHDKLAIYLLGMVSDKEKAYARSVKLLESVPEVMAQQPDSWVALANSYYHTDRSENARAALQHLLETGSNPRTAFLGGRVAVDAQDYPIAESLFRSVRFSYQDRAAVDFEIALVEYRAGHRAESERMLLDSVDEHHATSEGYVLLCTMLSGDGDDIRALQLAAQGCRAFPNAAELWTAKGSIELKLRYYSDAAVSYQKSAVIKDSAEARRGLATAQWRAGMRDRAVATLEQATRQFAHDARTYEVYGTLLAEDGSPENKARAQDLLKHALKLNDAAVESRYQLANLELADGNAEQALVFLTKAVELDSRDSRLHFALSRAYRRLNRAADADRETGVYQKLKALQESGTPKTSDEGTQP